MAGVKGQRSGGHNAKATSELRAAGTFRPDRHAGAETPEPPKGDPALPAGLSAIAKAEWARMVERLRASRTLTRVDDAALKQYVELYAETEQLKADDRHTRALAPKLERASHRLTGHDLVEAVSEIVKLQFLLTRHASQLRTQRTALLRFLVDLGMTPASRNRVKVTTPDEPKRSKLFAFLGGKASS